MSKRILYVVGTYPSLTETFIENEVIALRRLGLTIDVQGLAPLRVLQALKSVGAMPFASLKLWRSLLLPVSSSFWARARLWLRALPLLHNARAANHIHGHFLGAPATAARALAKVFGLEYSVTAHAHDIYVPPTHREVIRDASFRVTCTEGNRRYLLSKYPDLPFHLVRHWVYVSGKHAKGHSPRPSRIVAVGRCVEKKGFIYLVDACSCLRDEGVEFTCAIIGDGPERASLHQRAEELGLSKQVRFLGALPREMVISIYQDADILVVPSVVAANGDRDGVPNVILEAVAQGVPVVSTSVGGIPEAIQDGVTGLLVEPRDSVQLAAGIRRMLTDQPLRERLITRARACVQVEFSPERWSLELRQMFLGISEGNGLR